MALDRGREAAAVNLATKAEGRVISMNFYVRLTPPQYGEIGETDAATAIGRGLIRELMLVLKAAAEKEGFEVFMDATPRVY